MDKENNLNKASEENLLNYVEFLYDNILTQEKESNKKISNIDTNNLDNNKKHIIHKLININIMIKQLLYNDSVLVKKSSIHGNGVFAKYDIKKNSIITIYPVDSLYYVNNIGKKNLHFTENKFFNCIDNKDYMIGIYNDIEIYGDPNNISNNTLIGHIINDSASFIIDDENIDDISFKNIICKYVLNSNNNAIMKNNNDKTLYYIIATKDINEGDEILMSYQPKYWLNNKKLFKRFKSLLINDIKFKQFFLKIGLQKLSATSSIRETLEYFI
jgi:hypothetical protein